MPRRLRGGPLRHPAFIAFLAGDATGSTAAYVASIVLPLLVLDQTHSIGSLAVLRLVQTAPLALFGAVAGVVVDRVEKRRLLILGNVAFLVLMALVPVSVVLGIFSLELLYAIVFLQGTVNLVSGLAIDFSIVPALVDDDELPAANALAQSADRFASVIGPSIGGIAVALVGAYDAMWISVALYAVPLVAFFRLPLIGERRPDLRPLTPRGIADEVGEGLAYLWRSQLMRSLLAIVFSTNLVNSGIGTLLLFTLREEQGLDAATIGFALGASGVVQMITLFLAPRLLRGRPLGAAMLDIAWVMFLGGMIAALSWDWRVVVLGVTLRLSASNIHTVYTFLPRQLAIPAALRSRANGAFRTIILTATTVSPVWLAGVQSLAGTPTAFAATGVLGLVTAGLTLVSPVRRYEVGQTVTSEAVPVEGASEA